MFLGTLESWESQPLGEYFILQMWPVLALQFDFRFLSNDAAVLYLIILVLHLFPTIIYVLALESWELHLLGKYFSLLMWPLLVS